MVVFFEAVNVADCVYRSQIKFGINRLFLMAVLLPEQRSSYGHHRCVTPLYGIPMWNFNYVMLDSGGP